jgi:argininosuccinate lyase
VVAQAVRFAETQGRDLAALTLEELQKFSANIADDVFGILSIEGSLASRSHPGGTAPAAVRAAIKQARLDLAQARHDAF